MIWPPHVLIVDDKPDNLVALEAVLASLDAVVAKAASGEEALRLILRQDFALAILDVQMPFMDGYELAKLMRSDQNAKNIPIIFLSAIYSNAYHQFLGYQSGAVDFIAKPFNPEVLLCKVRVFLDLYKRAWEAVESRRRMESLLAERERANQALNREIITRRQAEEALVESREQLRTLINTIADIVMRFDRDGRHLFASDNVESFTGLPAAQYLGKTHDELGFPEKERRFWEDAIRQVFQTHASFETCFPFEGKNGTVVFNWRFIPEFDASGRIQSVLSLSRDITEQRRLEQDYQNLFREMLDGFAAHEIICDDEGRPKDYRFLAVNPAFERMTGLKAADIVGKTVLDVLPGTESSWIETYGKVALTGEPKYFENYSKDLGKYFEVTAFRPAPNQFACIFADITERRKAQEDLRRIFELSIDLICVVDIERAVFLRVNPAFTHTLGYTQEELLRESFLAFIHPDDVRKTMSILEDLKEGKSVVNFENRHRCNSGEYRWLNWFSQAKPDQGIAYAIARDVTERKEQVLELRRTRDMAEASNRAKSEFLANMSHEIRTPLNGIMGMLQLLELSDLEAGLQEYVGTAMQSSRRLTALLSDILDLSRIEAGRLSLTGKEFSFKELRSSILAMQSFVAREKGLELVFILDERLPPALIGDDVRLRQILFNIIGNALKFTEKGSVRVEVSPLPQSREGQFRVLFIVTDTGIGIADAFMQTIFEPFVQAEGSYARRFQGAGLGLSIVRRLVRLMDGELAIDSHAGEGTAIYLTLPFTLPETPKEEVRRHPLPAPARSGNPRPRALIAEDDACSLFAAKRMLEKFGYFVATAKDGREGLRVLAEQDFDVILMDVQMPVMSGIQATREIRNSAKFGPKSRTPIIAMTAYAMKNDKKNFLAAGMDDYIAKPIEIDEFREVLERVRRKVRLEG